MTQSQALDILKTGANVFLTGEPGSGKTFVTNAYVQYLKSAGVEVATTASTGIAATHIGGITIHSWAGIGIKKSLTNYDVDQITSNKRIAERMARTKVLIIDEISMLDATTLDMVNAVCKAVRQNKLAFGGLQIIVVGDFFQLPPISRDTTSVFAFTSRAWAEMQPVVCYITEQHRQEDGVFLELLSALRRNTVTEHHHAHLAERQRITESWTERTITKLFSHNADVDRINNDELAKLPGTAHHFEMTAQGKDTLIETLQRGCLSPVNLVVKKDAVVMFTKNSPTGLFVNGTLGTVDGFSKLTGYPIIKTKSGRMIETEPMSWIIEDDGKIRAQISQLPLRLAWAMTVHKSQGVSLDEAYIDLRQSFVEGQGYVALSRVRTLSGLYLVGWNDMALQVHPYVLSHDGEFRDASNGAEHTFSELPSHELTKMHHDFIRASGGSLEFKNTQHQQQDRQHVVARQRKPRVPKDKNAPSTMMVTKSFLDQKVSIADIAKTRELTEGTIVGHIEDIKSKYPNYDIEYLRPSAEFIAHVQRAQHVNTDGKLGSMKTLLEKEIGEVAYHDIRLALMFID